MPNGKPNILILWGDDIGISNLSCYSMGLMDTRPRTSTASPRKSWRTSTTRPTRKSRTSGIPLIFNLKTDPFERANITSNTYEDWFIDHAYTMGPIQMFVADKAQSLAEFPRRQAPPSFSIDQVIAKLQAGVTSS